MADDEEADDGDAASPRPAADAPPAGGEAQTLAFPSLAHRGSAGGGGGGGRCGGGAPRLGGRSARSLSSATARRGAPSRHARREGHRRGGARVVDADIAAPRTTTGSGARYVGNAADHKLSPRASGVNKRLHAAVGSRRAHEGGTPAAAEPGCAYPVDLPVGCALRETRACTASCTAARQTQPEQAERARRRRRGGARQADARGDLSALQPVQAEVRRMVCERDTV